MLATLRFPPAAVFVVLSLALKAQDGIVAWKGPNQPVYVVTQNHYAEGFSPQGRTPRFGELIMVEIYNPGATQGATVYAAGQSYALYSGGQLAGRVVVSRVAPLQCDSSAAVVSTDGFRFSANTMALATNAASIRTHPNFRRPADETQKGLMSGLAMAEFRKYGVTVTAAQIQLDDLVATAIGNSGVRTLIGTARTELDHVRHQVFLVTRLSGTQQLEAELSVYHKTTDLTDGKDSQNLRFVDQLDLDGDGTDEIVIEAKGYESEEFWIYRRVNGSWSRVWVGGQGGC